MKVRGEVPNVTEDGILGPTGTTDFIPLFIPIKTYEVVAAKAKELGCTAAAVFENALFEYLRSTAIQQASEEKPVPVNVPPPVLVKKRR